MKKLFELLIMIGSVLLFGTAGASDINAMHLADVVSRILWASMIIAVGVFGLSSMPKKKAAPVKRRVVCVRNCEIRKAA